MYPDAIGFLCASLKYNINVAPESFVYLKIRKDIYRLKVSSVLAFNKIVKALALHVNEPITNTTVLWIHKTHKTTFALCVVNIGVK